MAKTLKTSPGKFEMKGSPGATVVVRNPKTGQSVTVKGAGALRGDALTFEKGMNLLKPIAKQALTERTQKRKAQ